LTDKAPHIKCSDFLEEDVECFICARIEYSILRSGTKNAGCTLGGRIMNQATEEVITFINHPELDLGTADEMQFLQSPEAIRDRVEELLSQKHDFLHAEEAVALQNRLDEADWQVVVEELQARIHLTSQFFDGDAATHLEGNQSA
jgi:hypothetical protein